MFHNVKILESIVCWIHIETEESLYHLKQNPRIWYAQLTAFLPDSGISRRSISNTLFLKRTDFDMFVLQINVHDVVLGCSSEA